MKNLIENINENIIESMLTSIDMNILVESLQSSILTDLAKQMKQNAKDNSDSWYAKSSSFKNLFGKDSIKWSEVTDDKFTIVTVDAPEKERKEIEKKVRKLIKGDITGMVIVRDPKSKEFVYLIDNWGGLKNIKTTSRITGNRRNSDLNQKEKLSYLEGYDIYFLDLTGLDTWDIRKKRHDEKRGMIELDDWSLSEIAKENVKRYKEIIAKNKAQKLAQEDNTSELVNEIIQRSMDIAAKVNKDVIKYADLLYPVEKMLLLIYDKQTYDRKDHKLEGSDGLLKAYASYIHNKVNANRGSYADMYQKDTEEALVRIKETIKKLDNLMDEIEEKL